MYQKSTGKTPEQKRDEFIKKRIEVKDAREDSKQRSITISWAVNCATELCAAGKIEKKELEDEVRACLRLFDKLYEERSQEQARRYEAADEAMTAAELSAGDME